MTPNTSAVRIHGGQNFAEIKFKFWTDRWPTDLLDHVSKCLRLSFP